MVLQVSSRWVCKEGVPKIAFGFDTGVLVPFHFNNDYKGFTVFQHLLKNLFKS